MRAGKLIGSLICVCAAGAMVHSATGQPGGRPAFGTAPQEQEAQPTHYLKSEAFREKLDAPISATYQNVPLRRAVYELTHDGGLALVLDRRIDPSILIEQRWSGRSRRAVLEDLAEEHGGELAVVGDVLYLAPPEAARRLEPLIERRRRELVVLPAARRRELTRNWTLHWDDLESPQQVLERVAEHYAFALEGADRVPWDLWAGSTLPETAAVEQMSFVLAQFDLTYRWEERGAAARIVPIPPDELALATAPSPGRSERSRRARAPGKGGRAVFTASLQNKRLDAVLKGLAREAGFALTVDWEALHKGGVAEDRLVSVTAKRETLQQVLHKILDPLDVTFEVVGKHIYVPQQAE